MRFMMHLGRLLEGFRVNFGPVLGARIFQNRCKIFKYLAWKKSAQEVGIGNDWQWKWNTDTPRGGSVQVPGEGVGGGVNPSPGGEWRGWWEVCAPKPPMPRGLVGLVFWDPPNKNGLPELLVEANRFFEYLNSYSGVKNIRYYRKAARRCKTYSAKFS